MDQISDDELELEVRDDDRFENCDDTSALQSTGETSTNRFREENKRRLKADKLKAKNAQRRHDKFVKKMLSKTEQSKSDTAEKKKVDLRSRLQSKPSTPKSVNMSEAKLKAHIKYQSKLLEENPDKAGTMEPGKKEDLQMKLDLSKTTIELEIMKSEMEKLKEENNILIGLADNSSDQVWVTNAM